MDNRQSSERNEHFSSVSMLSVSKSAAVLNKIAKICVIANRWKQSETCRLGGFAGWEAGLITAEVWREHMEMWLSPSAPCTHKQSAHKAPFTDVLCSNCEVSCLHLRAVQNLSPLLDRNHPFPWQFACLVLC